MANELRNMMLQWLRAQRESRAQSTRDAEYAALSDEMKVVVDHVERVLDLVGDEELATFLAVFAGNLVNRGIFRLPAE